MVVELGMIMPPIGINVFVINSLARRAAVDHLQGRDAVHPFRFRTPDAARGFPDPLHIPAVVDVEWRIGNPHPPTERSGTGMKRTATAARRRPIGEAEERPVDFDELPNYV